VNGVWRKDFLEIRLTGTRKYDRMVDNKEGVMDKAIETLEALEAVGGRNEKIRLINEARDSVALQWLIYWSMSGDRFHITGYSPPSTGEGSGVTIEEVNALMEGLCDCQSSQQNKRTIDKFLKKATREERKWISRVVNKDLRCNVGGGIVNAVWDPNEFWGESKFVTLMLASKWVPGKVPSDFMWWAEVKIDGIRMESLKLDGTTTEYSRSGKTDPYNKTLSYIKEYLDAKDEDNFMMDKEFIADDGSWNRTITAARSTTQKTVAGIGVAFDYIDYDESEDWNMGMPLMERKKLLFQMFGFDDVIVYKSVKEVRERMDAWDPPIFPLGGFWVKEEDVMALRDEALEEGWEGLVLKDPTGDYFYGSRSAVWQKVKAETTYECAVTGIEEGSGRLKGTTGALWVYEPKGKRSFKVGTGFSDHTRGLLWRMWNAGKLKGMLVELKEQKETGTGNFRSRFPVFIRLREDISAEAMLRKGLKSSKKKKK